jgi:hypothetical protein
MGGRMKIKDILEIESIIDKRAIPSDILEFLDQTYYSKSKDEHIRFKDMHITHFLRVFINKDYLEDLLKDEEALERQIKFNELRCELKQIEQKIKAGYGDNNEIT